MKKFVYSAVSTAIAATLAAGVVVVPLFAHAATAPKPGGACEISGASRIVKMNAYVCLPNGTWTRGLPKSSSPLTTKDMWVKSADKGMTAAFGMITNPTNADIRIIAARSPRYATNAQLHEVVAKPGSEQSVMQEKENGFVIPAGKTVMLEPGGDHIMLMGVKRPIMVGRQIPILLIGSKGEQLRFTALAKMYSGANENYEHSGM